MKTFKAIPGPFGGIDEQATTDAFEEFVGGVRRAQRMLQLYKDSYPVNSIWPNEQRTKSEVFAIKAKRDGFTDQEIAAFMVLQ